MAYLLFEVFDVGFKKVGHGSGPCVSHDLDAASLLNHASKVALENFAREGKRHGWIGTELLLDALVVAPLLCHPSLR